jgi:predicted ATPase
MALHTGVADEREGDYFGATLNRCARILNVGHGEQILLSLGTEELTHGRLTSGASVQNLGEHYLKDLGEPEQIYQLTHPALRDDFPPLQSLTEHPNNLPVELSSFVGREHELHDIVKRLSDTRLLTLTGVGGSGKTRLALQAAAESVAEYSRGAWFVELAPVGDPDLIVHAIGDALRLSGGADKDPGVGQERPPLDLLIDHLRDRELLLLLDNCEHLITATAQLTTRLLQACPKLTVMTTTREGLGIPGEVLWQVPSLSLPSEDEAAVQGDAVRLFVTRAQATDPNFVADETTLSSVLQICRRLDGMPLAIELAAARIRMFNPDQIAERLDDRFRLLTGGSRTALPRHQTLEATVDWSFELLSHEEQLLFSRLAAFRGGFTLEAAEAVGAGGPIDRYDVLDLVGQLVDKSMVIRDELAGRFLMLETLRQYAQRRLTESDEVDLVRFRHLQTMLAIFEDSVARLRSPEQATLLMELQHDHDNLRAAIAYGLEHDAEVEATQLVFAAREFWFGGGHFVDMYEWTTRSAPFAGQIGDETTRAEFLMWASQAVRFRGDSESARSYLDQGRDLAKSLGNDRVTALWVFSEGTLAMDNSELAAAAAWFDKAIPLADAVDVWDRAWLYWSIGFLERMRQNLDEAETALGRAEDLFRQVGAPAPLAWTVAAGGMVKRYRGDYEGEVTAQQEAYEVFAGIDMYAGMSFALVCSAISLSELGRPEEAVVNLEQSIRYSIEHAGFGGLAEVYMILSRAHHLAGDEEASLKAIVDGLDDWESYRDDDNLGALAECVVIVGADSGEPLEYVRLAGWSDAVRRVSGRPLPPSEVPRHEGAQAATREAVGHHAFDAATADGASMDQEEALALTRQLLEQLTSGRAASGA